MHDEECICVTCETTRQVRAELIDVLGQPGADWSDLALYKIASIRIRRITEENEQLKTSMRVLNERQGILA